jgi:DUF1365 family protein
MSLTRDDQRVFAAGLDLRRRELTPQRLACVLAAYPAMTLKVIAAIYWQALKLWLRGCRTHIHPRKRTEARSR